MMQIQAPYEHRLQELEQRLIYAYARLDYLSARMESFISTNSALMQANATLYDNPPAAAPVDNHTSPYAPPAPATEEPAAEAVTTPPDADAADTVALPAESPSSIMVSSAAPQAPTRQLTANSSTELPGETVVSAPTTQASMAATVSPRKQDKPAATTAVVRKGNSPNQPGAGGWAINLASYTNQEIAASKLADFKRKGVSAEQVEATVKGKTIYRVRVAGFDTRMAARAQAETIKRQLGLKETWITKQ
jgi:cell division septation protein DedD